VNRWRLSRPPSSPSPFTIRREMVEICACAADFAQLVAAENASSRGFSPICGSLYPQ
jgi:hypothetical protein